VIALGLLTVAAVCHAAWNLLVKTSKQQGPEFVWLYSVVTAPVAAVAVGWSIWHGVTAAVVWSALVSTALHTGYAIVLQRAYAAAEFSVVYPVSRGTTPVLVALVAIPWTGWPSPAVWGGIGLVLCGVLVLDRLWAVRSGMVRGSALGLAVAAFSCAYTLWDAFAITELGAPVVPYLAVANLAQVAVLSAVVLPRHRVAEVVRHWRRAVPIALLVPASYGLVLVAMALEPVTAVAAGRTLNVVVGALLGVVVLRERLTVTRVIGLVAIIGGVVLVAG